MKTVGLFAGIGGIELGLQRAGHETVLLCENDPAAQAVLEERFPQVPLEEDVTTLRELPSDVELLAAGFPCQDLSQAGRTRGIGGERSGLVSHVFRLLRDGEIPWVLIENVPFMLRLNRGAAMDHIVRELEALGYRWAYRTVDTRAFGLPQRRRRVYLLAARAASPEQLLFADEAGTPEEGNHDGRPCGFYWTEGNRGLGWAVDAVPTLKGGSGFGIPSAPAIWFPDGRIETPDIRDAERLQGFQAGWTAPAERATKASVRWKLVGNAVSVPVAEWIGTLLNREPWTSLTGQPLAEKAPWPSAAFGSSSTRFRVEASEWPRHVDRPSLEAFLEHDGRPLSERAAAGFLSRLTNSSLRYPAEFEGALEAHLAAWREGLTPEPGP